MNGEQLEFLLNEKINREPHKVTPAETTRAEREKRRWPSDLEYRPWWMPQWDYSPSGMLVLELEEQYDSGLRRGFRDGKRQHLENLLNDFLAAAVAYAAAEKARREEHERQRREWNEQEQRRIEKQEQVGRTGNDGSSFLNGFCHWNEQIRSIVSCSISRAPARPRIQLARTLGVLSIGLRHTQAS